MNLQNRFTNSGPGDQTRRCAAFRNKCIHHMQLSDVCSGQRVRPQESWTAATVNGMFHRKSLWVVRFLLEQPSLASATWSKISSTWKFIPFPVACADFSLTLRVVLYMAKVSWFLVNASFVFPDWGCSVSALQALIRHQHSNRGSQKKGVRGPRTPEKYPRPHVESLRPILNSGRHIVKRRSGCVFPAFFDGGSEVKNGLEGITAPRGQGFIIESSRSMIMVRRVKRSLENSIPLP